MSLCDIRQSRTVAVLVPTGKMAESPSLRNFEPVFNILERLFQTVITASWLIWTASACMDDTGTYLFFINM